MKKKKGVLLEVKDKDIKSNNSKLWDDVRIVGPYAFFECNSLVEANIPSSVVVIDEFSFYESRINKVTFSEGLKSIEDGAFFLCMNLEEVVTPSSLIKIGSSSFSDTGVKRVTLNEGLEKIGGRAFFNCEKLEKIVIPSTVKIIEYMAFSESGVKEIIIKDGMDTIMPRAFMDAKCLEKIVLPKTLKVIDKYAFSNTNLNEIDLHEGITNINQEAFSNCKNLKSIIIPSSINTIEKETFLESGLKSVIIKEGVENINAGAFLNCKSLEYVEIPSSIKNIEIKAFCGCLFNYIYKTKDNKWLLSKNELVRDDIKESYSVEGIGASMTSILLKDNYKEVLNKIPELNKRKIVVSEECMNDEKLVLKMLDNENFDFIKRLLKSLKIEKATGKQIYCIYKLACNLGIFEEDKITRQKACNFIENALDKRYFTIDMFAKLFETMETDGYNKEWAEFIMGANNLQELLKLEKENTGFISRTYTDFYKVKEYYRSPKGSQRYRKVTIDAYKEYFSEVCFIGVDETNKDIAEVLGNHTRKQESFDNAVSIRNEYLKLKENKIVDDHILGEELSDKIDNIRNQIIGDVSISLKLLSKKANDSFTYEFLSKEDPENFVLGRYCSCCSHIEGFGYGIMKASILHPDCQNIVIRDEDNSIVGKTTIYVNRKQGYGVLNSIQIKTNLSYKTQRKIYSKILEAINSFAIKYNEKNEIKIKQINTGVSINGVEGLFCGGRKKNKILKGIDFSLYGPKDEIYYPGDWQRTQYVVWKDNKKK